jgi:hypothetical protein
VDKSIQVEGSELAAGADASSQLEACYRQISLSIAAPHSRAQESRVRMAFALPDAVLSATMTSLTRRAFELCGLSPYNVEVPFRSKPVRPSLADPECEDPVPTRGIRTGSRVLASGEFIEDLTGYQQRLEAAAVAAEVAAERWMSDDSEDDQHPDDADADDVDLIATVTAVFETLAAGAGRIQPSAPGEEMEE